MNTILDDIAVVIGLSPTLRLVAWFGSGNGNLYVPVVAEEGQLLPKIIGLSAARRLSQEWPGKHLNIPLLHNYEIEMRKRTIARLLGLGKSLREVATELQMSERRVSQIKAELKSSGLLVDGVISTPTPPDASASNVVPINQASVAAQHVHEAMHNVVRSGTPGGQQQGRKSQRREMLRLQGVKRK